MKLRFLIDWFEIVPVQYFNISYNIVISYEQINNRSNTVVWRSKAKKCSEAKPWKTEVYITSLRDFF